MDRVYMNRRTGEKRIHVEIDAAEIADVLADLAPDEGRFPHDATRQFVEILRAAHGTLGP
ncbi:hypothetical protein SSOG_09145 [Streptomyces himastatinicus ATCC 53653]|uniref:Uncharacterized protein n=1 Tax=Streptomyces himastatinicus ATCC 53653 TaxID=457427 RepID=D9WX03_9ACTN|nr:hypothetical protein [Streptomyces himastatinicus]EFL29431.1 hypothetical protein SSOG_09145 [Streptomyces himastatinicus ATCC 53653]